MIISFQIEMTILAVNKKEVGESHQMELQAILHATLPNQYQQSPALHSLRHAVISDVQQIGV
jgi:hypothetical protein